MRWADFRGEVKFMQILDSRRPPPGKHLFSWVGPYWTILGRTRIFSGMWRILNGAGAGSVVVVLSSWMRLGVADVVSVDVSVIGRLGKSIIPGMFGENVMGGVASVVVSWVLNKSVIDGAVRFSVADASSVEMFVEVVVVDWVVELEVPAVLVYLGILRIPVPSVCTSLESERSRRWSFTVYVKGNTLLILFMPARSASLRS